MYSGLMSAFHGDRRSFLQGSSGDRKLTSPGLGGCWLILHIPWFMSYKQSNCHQRKQLKSSFWSANPSDFIHSQSIVAFREKKRMAKSLSHMATDCFDRPAGNLFRDLYQVKPLSCLEMNQYSNFNERMTTRFICCTSCPFPLRVEVFSCYSLGTWKVGLIANGRLNQILGSFA